MKANKIDFQMHGNEQGILISIEECKDIPFEIRRIYYMFNTKEGVTRGHHAHKSLQQVLVCVHGSCKISLDDGKEKEIVLLNNPNEGIYLSNDIWREMYDFSPDAVLLVLASDFYEESDYIRDYDEFLKYLNDREDIIDGETSEGDSF